MELIHDFRYSIGLRLLAAAIRMLPLDESLRAGILRGIGEQREYDRYEAYCLLMCMEPVTFELWRELQATMRVRATTAERKNAALKSFGKRLQAAIENR